MRSVLISRILEFSSIVALGCVVFFASAAVAQQTPPLDSTRPVRSVTNPAKTEPPAATVPLTHRFWDRTNLLLFAGIALTRGMDYASTRNFQARGNQELLLADVVVNNSAGFASLEAAGTMTSVGISYILHRTGHHKLERWMSIGHIGVTAFGDIHNYSLKTRHPQ
jgi:hypothetical protein